MLRQVMEDIFMSEIVSHERSCKANLTKNSGVYSCVKDGYAVPVVLVAHVVLLLVQTQ
jgi:hypothetical protein